MKLNPKMGFEGQTRPNRYFDLKTKNWSHLGEEQTVKGGEEEEEKKKKRRRGGGRSSKKVWKLTLIMELNGSMEL